MSKFKNVLNFCRKNSFLVGETPENINLGLLGSILSNNLKNEWIYNNVTNRDINIFLNTESHLSDIFNYAKESCENDFPFGIAEIKPSENCLKIAENNNDYFHKNNQIVLKTHLFVSPFSSDQIFYSWQNQRRIWWRKVC